MKNFTAGWSSLVARQAHNLKVLGSNPSPATNQSQFNYFLILSTLFPSSSGIKELLSYLICSK